MVRVLIKTPVLPIPGDAVLPASRGAGGQFGVA